MSSELIKFAMQTLSCSQKELASKLSVSPTQITKWKKGEYMSFEMQEKIRSLLEIGELEPQVIWAFGSIENAQKWTNLITYLAQFAYDEAESGFEITPLIDEIEWLIPVLIQNLSELNYTMPSEYPTLFDSLYDDEMENEKIYEEILNHPFCSMIYEILRAYTDIYGFYQAYIADLDNEISLDSSHEWCDTIENIEGELISLAMIKADTELKSLETFHLFRLQVEQDYQTWINTIKLIAFKANIPLKAELIHLIQRSHDELGFEAEAESLGFNEQRLHPDIYMNELLTGMRLIHQVLPVILEKLGIDDFKIDEQNLSKF